MRVCVCSRKQYKQASNATYKSRRTYTNVLLIDVRRISYRWSLKSWYVGSNS